MKHFKINGQAYAARDAADLVHQLAAGSFSPAADDQAWMAESAERVLGHTIRSDTPDHYVEDLLRAGLLTEEVAS